MINIELMPTEQAKKEGAEDPKEKFEEVHGQAGGKDGADDDELD